MGVRLFPRSNVEINNLFAMKIGFLGTGLMGQAMVERLLSAQVSMIAYNRTKSKLDTLKEAGAEIANSPIEAIQASNCLILMLANADAIKEVILSENVASSLTNRTVIQMGTISPSQSREIQKAVTEKDGDYLNQRHIWSIDLDRFANGWLDFASQ
ncbi:NAD(P)-dependent oxidoreductase [Pleurocapsa sp. PCC 7327]|uniref:NAD(P)-dependent oxidoreductase n=1 Tax=Pleurocapsa sp. PCC 7327 TaxID=118163 RepID=UPI0035288717